MKPVLIAYNEGIFEFKQKEFLELGETAMEISVLPMLNLRLDSGNFGFQLTITIKSHDDELLRYGFVTVMKIAGWIPVTSADNIQKSSGEDVDGKIRELLYSRASEYVKSSCAAILDFTSGAFAGRVTGAIDSKRVSLPDIPLENLMDSLHFRLI